MDWFLNLLQNPENHFLVAHVVLLYAFVIATGVLLGKIKIGGISLGVTFVLFMGIAVGHVLKAYGIDVDPTGTTINGDIKQILHFIQEFGLILFVFCIGLQVGPSFFSSFKKGGVTMNLIAVGIIVLNVAITIGAFLFLGGKVEIPMMVGVMCGAVTNTPALGAGTQVASELGYSGADISLGYACAYPLGVLGIIGAIILIRYICHVDLDAERRELEAENGADPVIKPVVYTIEMQNDRLDGKKLVDIARSIENHFVISRVLKDGKTIIPTRDTVINLGEKMLIVSAEADKQAVITFIGREDKIDWEHTESPLVSRRIVVTESNMNGKKLGTLQLRNMYGVNITRIRRAGTQFFAFPSLELQVGDKLTVVGREDKVEQVAHIMGNSLKHLDHPNMATIFIGILVGIIFGMIPIFIPGMSAPVKLGIAGGPLVIAILIGRFGYKFKLVTYTSNSANMMLREIGLALFLASVGIKAGFNFYDTVVDGDGLLFVGIGFLITFLPLLIMGIIGKLYCKINYFKLMGLIAGSCTDPPALAYSSMTADNNAPAVGYSTVYPLAMFLRILMAQLVILIMF